VNKLTIGGDNAEDCISVFIGTPEAAMTLNLEGSIKGMIWSSDEELDSSASFAGIFGTAIHKIKKSGKKAVKKVAGKIKNALHMKFNQHRRT